MKYLMISLLIASSAWAQTPSYGDTALAGAAYDRSAAATVRPAAHKSSDPATCAIGAGTYIAGVSTSNPPSIGAK